jgi:4-amino-4-deoxy-L-arabinose transferase-like glycosyltransferase
MKRLASTIQHPPSNVQSPISNLQSPSPTLPRASYLLLLALLLLASFLRFYHLDAQSFWNDEGNSARIAERPVDLILEGAKGDIHPPGYYLLLHAWRAAVGHSEFALRSLSVVAGLALVIFTYLLGRHLFDDTTGLIAASLAALSPFAIYYSQETRMYALLAALSAASTYLLVLQIANRKSQIRIPHSAFRILHSPFSTLHSLPYILTAAAGLYTHYAFPFVLLVHNVTFGLWWLAVARRSAQRWRWLAWWAGVQAAVIVLYLPWLPVALKSVTGWSPAGRAYALGPALLDVWHVLTVGITLPLKESTLALVVTGALLLAGLWPRRSGSLKASHGFAVASMALYLLLPIALLLAFDLYKESWLKFLVVVLPPFHVLVAHGVENLAHFAIRDWRLEIGRRRISNLYSPFSILHSAFCILTTTLLAIAILPSLRNLYLDPAYARDDYRQIAADVAAIVRPGDAIVLNAPNQWEVFTYYYPDQDLYPAPYRPEPGEVEPFLAPLVERYRRLFVLYWGDAESDPRRLVETWLATHTYPASDRWYGRVRLATYGVAPLPGEPAVTLDARFGEGIHLRGYALAGERFAPGHVLPVTLFWEAQVPSAEPYKVTVQLLDGAGQLVAQRDAQPGAGLRPTTTWQQGQVLADRYGVPLPADLAPGRYTLIVGVYHIATGERLPVTLDSAAVGDHLSLTSVGVTW